MSKKDIIIGVAGLLLLGTAVTGLTGWYKEHQRLLDMTRQVAELTEKESPQTVSARYGTDTCWAYTT